MNSYLNIYVCLSANLVKICSRPIHKISDFYNTIFKTEYILQEQRLHSMVGEFKFLTAFYYAMKSGHA